MAEHLCSTRRLCGAVPVLCWYVAVRVARAPRVCALLAACMTAVSLAAGPAAGGGAGASGLLQILFGQRAHPVWKAIDRQLDSVSARHACSGESHCARIVTVPIMYLARHNSSDCPML